MQVLIEHRFTVLRFHIFWHLLIPFILQLRFFIIYSNVFNGQISNEEKNIQTYEERGFLALSILLLISSGYFLLHELAQIIKDGKDYFTKYLMWNFVDLITQAMIIAIVIVKMKVRYEKFEPHAFILTIHSITSLMMWIKTFYFLRLFDTTSKNFYLINLYFRLSNQDDFWFIKWYESLPSHSFHCWIRFWRGIFETIWRKHRRRLISGQLRIGLSLYLKNQSGKWEYW